VRIGEYVADLGMESEDDQKPAQIDLEHCNGCA
jgi:hypothetical protein